MQTTQALHERARSKGASTIFYWIVRALFTPFFLVYFRMERIGREFVPKKGPVILAANHRSFLDPFVIATLGRRPFYYVAKREMFANRLQGWALNALGAFPVDRGNGDNEMLETAKTILARGDALMIFPEGTRTRPGTLGQPRRGVGRLALETGAPVVPVAVIGTEAIRRGWRIRPHRVRIRAGRALTFPRVESPSPQLAAAVTDRIWPCVMLQWEWLGGLPPLRRAAVIGAGSWGTSVAVLLARAGLEVDLGCRTREQADAVARARENERYLAGVELPQPVNVMRAADLELTRHDLVCFAVPASDLPAAVAAHGGDIPRRAGVLVLAKGLVPPLGTLPSAYVAERVPSWAVGALGGPAHAREALDGGAALVVGAPDRGFSRQVVHALSSAGVDVTATPDLVGVELAGCATNAAALAVAAASHAGPGAAGAAAGRIFAEVDAVARREGSSHETFAGLAGAGDLVATVLGAGTPDRHAGELVPLLADRAAAAGVAAPVLAGLASVVEGRVTPEQWTAELTQPAPAGTSPRRRSVTTAAAGHGG
jgi:glycerol-3-phosphate dehydrogenase (NAD(P)+)